MPTFGLKTLHDSRYEELDTLVIDEKSLPPSLPAVLDYSESGDFPAIDNQNGIGSCTAYSARKQFEFYRTKREGDKDLISARAIYGAAKNKFYPNDKTDDGLQCSDVLTILSEFYVNESDWPSVPNDSSDFPSYLIDPPTELRKTDFLLKNFVTVNTDVMNIKKALYKNGIIMVGIAWASEWMNTGSDGLLPMPFSVAGGHAVTMVGYDDTIVCPDGTKGAFKIANNWTTAWAKNGYCYLPYSYYNVAGGQFWPTNLFTLVVPKQ